MILANNVTDMVEALDRSERSEQRLNLAIEVADLHIWEADFAERKLFTAGAADFYDRAIEFEEVVEQPAALVDPRDRERIVQAWLEHAAGDQPFRQQYRLARADGRELWVEHAVQSFNSEAGRPVRAVGAMQNITTRKAAEQALIEAKEAAEASNRAKSTFLATMSHEIRTPLNGVLGMAQAMAAEDLSDGQRERLDVIRQSGETLLAILNDVLDLSKIEAGKLELEETEFDIQELARGAYAAFTAIANKKGLSFALQVDPAAEGVYRGDSTRVRQILYNLVSNAIKFTDQGEVRVRVARGDEALELSVTDSGIGIAPEPLSRLFAKFEQADSTTTRRYGGTGLGLAICREFAELMGGTIVAESRAGEGSCFTARLPLARVGRARKATRARAPTPTPTPTHEVRALRVLAAEDNAVNQLVLKTLLHQAGLNPTLVPDGAAAVAAWEAETWDVILMDIQMPGMDGPTACRLIREREAATGRTRTPIIALTANAMAHQVAEYLAGGMDGFVAKPIEVGLLYAAMEEALQSREAQAAAAG
jgi:signal transduction histidine kinase